MNMRRAIPGIVVGMGGLVAGVVAVQLATGAVEDYADLVPAPDTIIWEQGQQSTLLVSTNREDVDLRVNSVALGIANVQGSVPHSGELMVLGASVGCQDWAVSRLTADAISTGGFTLKGNIDRDNFTATAQVHFRTRVQGDEWGTGVGSPIDVDYDAGNLAASNRFELSLSASNDDWEVEASSDDDFPTALTRFITIDTTEGTATLDEEAESIVLLKETGVALKACSEHDDVLVSLHGEEGAELNRYVVDIGPEPAATAVPTATPDPRAGYKDRRVCPDDGSGRADYLTGGEDVGAALPKGDFDLPDIASVVIGNVPGSGEYRYFFRSNLGGSGSVQLIVTDAGAGDTQGLDVDRIYPVRLTATSAAGVEKFLDVAVWLDNSTLSPNDDGRCS